jgi:hypothetical protein
MREAMANRSGFPLPWFDGLRQGPVGWPNDNGDVAQSLSFESRHPAGANVAGVLAQGNDTLGFHLLPISP